MNKWYLNRKGKAEGPLSTDEISILIKDGQLSALEYLYKTGSSEWKMAQDHEELQGFWSSTKQNESPLNAEDIWVVLKKVVDQGDRKFLQKGPFNQQKIADFLLTGELTYFDYAWKKGMERWVRIGEVPELSGSLEDKTQLAQKSQDDEETIEIEEPLRANNTVSHNDSPTIVLREYSSVPIPNLKEDPPKGSTREFTNSKGTATILFEQSDYDDSQYSFDPDEKNVKSTEARVSRSHKTSDDSKDSSELVLDQPHAARPSDPKSIQQENADSQTPLATQTPQLSLKSKKTTQVKRKSSKPKAVNSYFAPMLFIVIGAGILVTSGIYRKDIVKQVRRFAGASLSNDETTVKSRVAEKNNLNPLAVSSSGNQQPPTSSVQKQSEVKKTASSVGDLKSGIMSSVDRTQGQMRVKALERAIDNSIGEQNSPEMNLQKFEMPKHHSINVGRDKVDDNSRDQQPSEQKKLSTGEGLQVFQESSRKIDIYSGTNEKQWIKLIVESKPKKILEKASVYFVLRKVAAAKSHVLFDLPKKLVPDGSYQLTASIGDIVKTSDIFVGASNNQFKKQLRADLKKTSFFFIRDRKAILYGIIELTNFFQKLRRSSKQGEMAREWRNLKTEKLSHLLISKVDRVSGEFGYPKEVFKLKEIILSVDQSFKAKKMIDAMLVLNEIQSLSQSTQSSFIF